MSTSIEDILRSHGIGGGKGVNVVTATVEPTVGLNEGLFWYNPDELETKMYLQGAFRNIGGGGLMLVPFFARATTTAVTSTVAVPSTNYNPTEDVLLVSQNGITLTESIDFTVNRATKSITKITGSWDVDTNFDFTILSMTKTGSSKDSLTLVQLEDHVTVAAGVNTVTFSIPGFDPAVDIIRVHQRNLEIFRDIDWTMNPDGSSITLGYTLEAGEEFHFTALKKVRDQYPEGTVDGLNLINGTVGKVKLATDFVAEVDAKETPDAARRKVEQTSYSITNSGKDTSGIFTTVQFRRKVDNTLAISSVLSGGTSPLYTTRTLTYYGTDGTTVEKTEVFTLTYDADGDLVSEV